MARAATTSDAFNAIAEPRRRQILELLVQKERSVGDLVELLGVAQPQVSKHLTVLRYGMVASGCFEVAFHGEFREIVPNERLVTTEVYEGAPDDEALTTTTFADVDGRTRVEVLVRHATTAARDMHLESGMEDGLQRAL